jgi:hypothetical protein
MDKLKSERVSIYRFTVRGIVGARTPFPIDMLRYDQAWPATGEEAQKFAPAAEPVEIILYGLSCTPARWKTFGWDVL